MCNTISPHILEFLRDYYFVFVSYKLNITPDPIKRTYVVFLHLSFPAG